ncbi:YNL195C-like protein [Saccharomyces cerevisiae x Saccharomyces kudriavzevii VIN7]|uniref:YNL195C-like protein n=1 Tax=Saccharomyces cerevisiae x Saccharomyces kudriavzevii (strain VIN7) TaxID=1095631 RepID=H0GZZ5_SACCK|nr:YNL195C-like protein [Saccharomyces cerevisiae x Saccharomyces kudriavzevii VIN7]
MLGLGQSAQVYANDGDANMNQAKSKKPGIPGCGMANDLEYPHGDKRSSSNQHHFGILPSECPGPTLNTGAGSVGIPGCGKVTNKVVNDHDGSTRSTLANFDVSKMTEARMNSRNVPPGCQNTSMPHFDGSIDQHIPGAGSPQPKSHHIDAWDSISSCGADNNNQDMMHPQAAPLDRYSEHMVRDETSDNATSSYTVHAQGSPANISSATQKVDGRKNHEYGMNDRQTVPRDCVTVDTNLPTNRISATGPNIANVKNEVLHD